MRYACLLRGVNVTGSRPVAMPTLRTLCERHGFTSVSSYLASGNIILDADQPPEAVAGALQAIIADGFGHDDVDVAVLDHATLSQILADCPAGETEADRSRWHITVLMRPADADASRRPGTEHPPDRYVVSGRVVYVHCPNGYGRTKLHTGYFERSLGIRATTRNWNTATRLAALAAPGASAPET